MEKTRDIPICDLFIRLQMEYIDYKVKSLIYRSPYCDKYVNICEGKKSKIKKIADSNHLNSIFQSKEKYDKMKENFFNDWGLPNFEYRTKSCKDMMSYYDNLYYFSKNSSIVAQIGDEELLGEIIFNNVKGQCLTVRIPGFKDYLEIDYGRARRVFSKSFLESMKNA